MIEAKFVLDLANMSFVKGSIQNKIMRIAINKAAAPVKAAVIAHAPRGKGSLSKAMIIKVKFYKTGDVWIAVIGASSKFSRSIGRGKGRVFPSKYARLVEVGTKYRKATPYLKPSLAATQEKYIADMTDSIRDQLAVALSKK